MSVSVRIAAGMLRAIEAEADADVADVLGALLTVAGLTIAFEGDPAKRARLLAAFSAMAAAKVPADVAEILIWRNAPPAGHA